MNRTLLSASAIVIALAAALMAAACSGPPRTAEEFITAYAEAYRSGDVDAIMALRYDLDLARRAGVREDLAQAIDDFTREKDRAEIERDLAGNGQWAAAWAGTRFVSERPHDDHIHVTVSVRDLPPMELVVLVRDGETLKLHPRPSAID